MVLIWNLDRDMNVMKDRNNYNNIAIDNGFLFTIKLNYFFSLSKIEY